eukprot:scaffold100391_cov56-Phaeocystis_antarctica.AAC.3
MPAAAPNTCQRAPTEGDASRGACTQPPMAIAQGGRGAAAGEAKRRPGRRTAALTPPHTSKHAAAQHLRQPEIHVRRPEVPHDPALGLNAAD